MTLAQKDSGLEEEHRQELVRTYSDKAVTVLRAAVEKGFLMAKEVDTAGRVIVATTTKEHAELKRDQIHAFGPDPLIARCAGSMSAVIEPSA